MSNHRISSLEFNLEVCAHESITPEEHRAILRTIQYHSMRCINNLDTEGFQFYEELETLFSNYLYQSAYELYSNYINTQHY